MFIYLFSIHTFVTYLIKKYFFMPALICKVTEKCYTLISDYVLARAYEYIVIQIKDITDMIYYKWYT